MTQSKAPKPSCLGTALLCFALAVIAGCGPSASPPAESAGADSPSVVISPTDEPNVISPSKADPEPTADLPDSEPEPIEPQDADVVLVDKPSVEPVVDRPPLEPHDEPNDQPDPEPEPLEPKDSDEPMLEPVEVPYEQPEPEPARDLGPPLVENVEELKKLDPAKPVWLDVKKRRVVTVGQVCLRDGGLEMFACLKDTKEHESIVTVDVKALTVHAGLLASGAMVGGPVRFDPMYVPAKGTEIEITLVWKDEKGKRTTARAQDWILDAETNEPMTHPWVFAGSGFWVDERAGKTHYMADGGDFICVSNFPTAMLDLPIESSQATNALMYRALTSAIPPLGTPVTLILTPKTEED